MTWTLLLMVKDLEQLGQMVDLLLMNAVRLSFSWNDAKCRWRENSVNYKTLMHIERHTATTQGCTQLNKLITTECKMLSMLLVASQILRIISVDYVWITRSTPFTQHHVQVIQGAVAQYAANQTSRRFHQTLPNLGSILGLRTSSIPKTLGRIE